MERGAVKLTLNRAHKTAQRLWNASGGSDGEDLPGNAQQTYSIPWIGKIPLEKGIATHSSILVQRIPQRRLKAVYGSVSIGSD